MPESCRYAALLRGINVGGHRVKMDRLRDIFGQLGYADIETLIASGNVFFSTPSRDAAALESEIEAHLHSELGWEVATFIRTAGELAAVIECAEGRGNDLQEGGRKDGVARDSAGASGNLPHGDENWRAGVLPDDDGSCYVIFFAEPVDADTAARFEEANSSTDDFQVNGREVFWRLPGKLSDSPLFGREFDRIVKGLTTTVRNITTVRRLLAKLAEHD